MLVSSAVFLPPLSPGGHLRASSHPACVFTAYAALVRPISIFRLDGWISGETKDDTELNSLRLLFRRLVAVQTENWGG